MTGIPLRNRHIFGLITSPAFHDYTWDRLHQEEHLVPMLNAIKQGVKEEKVDKPIEYVILTVEENNEAGNGGANTYSLFFYVRLDLGKTKSGEPARIKKMLSQDVKTYSPVELPFSMQLWFSPNPYEKKPNPLKTHLEQLKEKNLPVSKWDHFELDKTWVPCDTVEADCMDEVLSCSTQEEAKDLLRASLDSEELAASGVKKLKAYKEFQRQSSGPKPFNPAPFCEWGLKKLDDLKSHALAKDPLLKKLDRKCKQCREFRVWDILKHWYDDIYVKQKVKGKHKLNDGTIIDDVLRKRFLVVKGNRKTGKTKFFKNLVNYRPEHIAWVKHKFSRENTSTIGPDCWLLILDDFSWSNHNREMMKGVTSADATELDGKWLSKALPPGIPCVLLCNDSEDTLYKGLKHDPDFKDEAIFCDLKDVSLVPEDIDNSSLEYHGPSATLDSDEEHGSDAANMANKTIAVVMQDNGKPSHLPMDDYENLLRKFEDQTFQFNKMKHELNALRKDYKNLMTDYDDVLKGRNRNEHFIIGSKNMNEPSKKIKTDSLMVTEDDSGVSKVTSTAKSANSSGRKGASCSLLGLNDSLNE